MQKVNFVISIKDTQRDSWQGTIYWAEKKKEMCFRSSLELLILMESAIKDKEEKRYLK